MEPSTPADKNDIERYVELRKQIADLETQLEELKPKVAERVHKLGDNVKFGDYVLRSQVTRSWTYTEAVDALQKQLTEKRREEVAQGIAQLKKTRFVMMTSLRKPPEQPHDPDPLDDIPY